MRMTNSNDSNQGSLSFETNKGNWNSENFFIFATKVFLIFTFLCPKQVASSSLMKPII